MASFNKVILLGNLTRDPETRVTANDLTICKMGLAVSRVFSTRDGERREETTFVDIDAFGRQAEVITKYLRKGSPIMIEGRLRLDQWETNDGQKRQKLCVVLENFQFVGGRNEDGSSGSDSGGGYEPNSPPKRESQSATGSSSTGTSSTASSSASSSKSDFSAEGDTLDEDVPF